MSSIGSKPGQTQSYLTAVAMDLGMAVVQDTTAEGAAKMPTGANERPLGLVLAKAEANKLVTLVQGGYYWAKAGAPIVAVGTKVIIGGVNGRVITDPETSGVISHVVGFAEMVAAADGDQIIVRIDMQDILNP